MRRTVLFSIVRWWFVLSLAATRSLGYDYAEGIAVEKDYAKARQWFQTANDRQLIGSRGTRGRPANSRCRKGAGRRTKATWTALALRGQISPH